MNYSKDGLALTEQFEGFRDTAYQDVGGVWTIAFGHTKGVHPGMTCTREQGEAWLLEDVADAANAVNLLVKIGVTQNEFDALTDFCFNVGVTAFRYSTMLKKLNANDIDGAANEFDRWNKVSGVVVAGLIRRRNAEKALFISADPPAAPQSIDASQGESQPQPEPIA